MRMLVALSVAFLFAGCVTQVRNASLDRIAECNAGFSYSVTAKLEAKISENLANDSKADAGIEEDLKGHFINNAKVSEVNAVNLYGKYLECLNTPRPG